MTKGHAAVLSTLLIAIALQLGSIQHWHEVKSPAFIAGLLLSVGSAIGALYTEKVELPNALTRTLNPGADRKDS